MPQRKSVPDENPPTDPPSGPQVPWDSETQDAADPLRRVERHRQFGPLLELSPDAIVIVDADGLVREWNPAAEPMLQTISAEAVHSPLRELLSTPHRELSLIHI